MFRYLRNVTHLNVFPAFSPAMSLLFWFLAFLLLAVVTYGSLRPAPPAPVGFTLSDKFVHIAAYGLLSISLVVACQLGAQRGRNSVLADNRTLLELVIFCALWGILMELFQGFALNRNADFFDAVANFIGAAIFGPFSHRILDVHHGNVFHHVS